MGNTIRECAMSSAHTIAHLNVRRYQVGDELRIGGSTSTTASNVVGDVVDLERERRRLLASHPLNNLRETAVSFICPDHADLARIKQPAAASILRTYLFTVLVRNDRTPCSPRISSQTHALRLSRVSSTKFDAYDGRTSRRS